MHANFKSNFARDLLSCSEKLFPFKSESGETELHTTYNLELRINTPIFEKQTPIFKKQTPIFEKQTPIFKRQTPILQKHRCPFEASVV